MTTAMFDGREMSLLHNAFRREFSLMPRLVRGANAGDHERAGIVASHIIAMNTFLHHHHSAEDTFVWPFLLRIAPAETAELVELMEDQHRDVAELGDAVHANVLAWQADPSAQRREALAAVLDRLIPVLKEHLATEEKNVVPLMEKHIPAAEWNRIVQQGAADADPETIPLNFGMLMYEGDPQVIENAIAGMPPEVGPVIRRVAPQAYGAYAQSLYGTPTPPRSTELD